MYFQNIKSKTRAGRFSLPVKLLTLTIPLLAISACSLQGNSRYSQVCNSHAYLQQDLQDYLTQRFSNRIPLRLGIIPLSVPENLSYKDGEYTGVGSELALELKNLFLEESSIAIVEIFNRQDWPGKREEATIGNFSAIDYANEAGYDLIISGYLERPRAIDQLTAVVKLIEVETGTTVYYGKTTVTSTIPYVEPILSRAGIRLDRSNQALERLDPNKLVEELAVCIKLAILGTEE